jgi:selenocysteine lyase/cysteine desulfurase
LKTVSVALVDLLKACPEYADTGAVDALRAAEYRRLDEQGHAYLDYTGGSLYADSQIRAHLALLGDRVLGNPHSASPTSSETTGLVEDAPDVVAAIEESPDLTLPRFLQVITHRGGKSAGAIRVSLGVASNLADVSRFVQFAEGLRDQTPLALGEVTFDIESCRVIRDGS